MQTGAFLTATGMTVGTPTYMAPEQAMARDIGPWTDLYSVGCMAFEMFTGRKVVCRHAPPVEYQYTRCCAELAAARDESIC
jgi:serine/threonine protein kinase